MVQIPTFDTLPSVAPARPDLTPRQGAASAAPFGEAIGVGEQSLGLAAAGLGQAGNKIATDFAVQNALRASKQADADSIGYANNLGYKSLDGQGGPGFYAMRGQAAIDHQQTYLDALTAQAKQTAAGMDDRTKQMYLNQFQLRLQNETSAANRFVMREQGIAAQETSVARMGAASDAAVNTYNDPIAIEHNAQIIRGEMADQGQREGWSPETLAEKTRLQLSKTYGDVIKSALARNDVPGAAAAFNLYGPQMDAASNVSMQEHLREPLLRNNAVIGVNKILGENTTVGDGRVTGGVAAKDLPPEQQAFLNTLAGPESAGKYNVRYTPSGGASFDPAMGHPEIHEPTKDGSTSDAAGRYQFLSSTYKPIAAKLGLTGFSAPEQDKAAIDLAATTYGKNTGRDLAADLKEGGHAPGIAQALNKVWPSLPGGSQQGTTSARFEAGLSSMPSDLPTATTVPPGWGAGHYGDTGVGKYPPGVAKPPPGKPLPMRPDGTLIVPSDQLAGPGASMPSDLPTAASVAAATKIHPDFSAAADAVMAQTAGDPALQHAMMSELRSRESIYNLGVRSQQQSLAKSVPDTIAALESGRTDAVIPELAIRHAYDPEKADAIVAKLNEAKENGRVFSSLKFMSPGDFATQRQALVDSLGPHNSIPKKGTPSEPPDMSGQFNTPLNPQEQTAYAAWLKAKGGDPAKASFDYDMQGAFKAGIGQSENGHFPDTFKKPNHPTFSDQSQYSSAETPGGTWVQNGDKWEFKASPHNLTIYGAGDLQQYFTDREPGNTLTLPTAAGAGIQGFAQRQKELATLDRLWTQRQAAIRADPAAYVQNEPSVKAAFAADMSNPENVAKAVQQSMTVQQQLDPGATPHAISTSAVASLVQKLHTIDPKDGDAGAALDAMAKQYGSAWPSVMHDLVNVGHLNGGYMTLASMDTPQQSGGRADLQAALKDQANKGDKFGSGVPGAQKAPMQQAIDDALDLLMRSMAATSSNDMVTGAVKPAVETLATYYAERGVPGPKAAQDAYDRVVGDKYQISDMIRTPRTFNGIPLSPDAVIRAGASVTGRLTDADLTTTGPAGVTAAQARGGQWATNPDGQGVTLVVKRATGGWMPVRTNTGSYVQMPYGALPKVEIGPAGIAEHAAVYGQMLMMPASPEHLMAGAEAAIQARMRRHNGQP